MLPVLYLYRNCVVHFSHETHLEEMERLEKEQEQLNSSLLALTTHFAQVQFRLKQIVSAEAEDKEVELLLNTIFT